MEIGLSDSCRGVSFRNSRLSYERQNSYFAELPGPNFPEARQTETTDSGEGSVPTMRKPIESFSGSLMTHGIV
ncbi:hypothetical protein CEXT_192221 [Caerostris extrusa]|uniref:Uncharacterized protein n=1 Tax=Caerostris extrusa TaxID=172846 RepID=A0AAV4WVZ2_CAEEX|nr:hypothetical protein CEXT_192221 [Caerostris extrusa]